MIKRGGCLTAWLVLILLGSALRAGLILVGGIDTPFQGAIALSVAFCAWGALLWKKWGAYGVGASCLLSVVVFGMTARPEPASIAVVLVALCVLCVYVFLVWRAWARFDPNWTPPKQQTRAAAAATTDTSRNNPRFRGHSEEPIQVPHADAGSDSTKSKPSKTARHARCGCRAKNDADAEFCTKCGASLKPIPCPKCDKDNDCDAEFCDACGSPLRDAKCASCGTTNKPDSSFCKKCGSKLESAGSAGSP